MILIAGIDEVGRGPLAGAVLAAAVILNPKYPIKGLTDSKKLSEKKRKLLDGEIREKAIAWSIGRAEVEEIDRINILQASLLAMERAVEGLSVKPDHLKIDGNKLLSIAYSMESIVKGDLTVEEISAASIIAKVARDKEMVSFDVLYPEYGFAAHKGYPTKKHREALVKYGVTPIHRQSFSPVKACL